MVATVEQRMVLSRGTKPENIQPLILPTALGDGGVALWITSVTYLLVAVVATAGFLRAVQIAQRRSETTTFRASFLCASALFMFLRGFCSMVEVPWDHHMFWLYACNLFGPVYLQYWTFSLLILFVGRIHLVVKDRLQAVPALYGVYTTFQLAAFGLAILASLLVSRRWNIKRADDWDKDPAVYVGILYTLLSVGGMAALYRLQQMKNLLVASSAGGVGHLEAHASADGFVDVALDSGSGSEADTVSRTSSQHTNTGYGTWATPVPHSPATFRSSQTASSSRPDLPSRTRFKQFSLLIVVYLAIFFCRAVWNYLYYMGKNPLQHRISNWITAGNQHAVNWTFFGFYMFFEIIPTALVVNIFAVGLFSRSPLGATSQSSDDRQNSPLLNRAT